MSHGSSGLAVHKVADRFLPSMTAMESNAPRMPSVIGMNLAQARAVISTAIADPQVTIQHSAPGKVPPGMVLQMGLEFSGTVRKIIMTLLLVAGSRDGARMRLWRDRGNGVGRRLGRDRSG